MKLKFLALMVLASFSVAAQASVGNLVVNGDFESGNVAFASDYSSELVEQDSLMHERKYFVGSDTHAANLWFDLAGSPFAGNKMMMVNGSRNLDSTKPDSVWGQTVAVAANTDYFFSTMVAALSTGSPAELNFSINGSSIAPTFTALATGEWKLFSAVWNSGSNTSANLNLVNFNSAKQGNDFALDNIAMSTTAPVPEPETYALMGLGLVGLVAARRRKLQAAK
jgi:hypothetical protein